MTNYLPAVSITDDRAITNLDVAQQDVGSGGTGEIYLKVNKNTGALTFGQTDTPLPHGHRFVIGLHTIKHGYLDWDAGQKRAVARHLVAMVDQPMRPIPPGGEYAQKIEQSGPRNVDEIELASIDEPGFKLSFTSWSVSNANRVRALIAEVVDNRKTEAGQSGFVHPVVEVSSDNWKHKDYGVIHHIDFKVVDWLHRDGQTLLSARTDAPLSNESAPWDDDEEMTAEEREVLRAE